MPGALARSVLAIAMSTTGCMRGDRAVAPLGTPTTARSEPRASGPLDDLLVAHWRATGVEPAPEIDDAGFLRRASLDLIGRIPTVEELDAIESDDDPDRRAKAVDRMLASDEHAQHLASTTTDLLLGRALKLPMPVRNGTETWLKQQFAADAGWDATARALLTAEGEHPANGPGGFVLSHGRNNRIAALAGETARVFLGASIQCAQCHDHPDDASFTQRDFYGFAAYFARTRVRPIKTDPIAVALVDRRFGEARLPKPTDAPEEPTGEVVAPKYFGASIPIDDPRGRRAALASAIVADPAFARAWVNRTWAALFGRGWIADVDALPREGAPPPVLDLLARDFVASGYDHDALLRRIVLSTAYARSSQAEGTPEQIRARVAAFAQAGVRPIGPEPLLRSLAVVAGVDDDAIAFRRERAALRELRFAFADDEGAADEGSGSVTQALLLQNGNLVQQAVKLRRARGLGRTLADLEDPSARIDALVRRAYGRVPTEAERQRVLTTLGARADEPAAWEDVLAALVLSSEFLTNH